VLLFFAHFFVEIHIKTLDLDFRVGTVRTRGPLPQDLRINHILGYLEDVFIVVKFKSLVGVQLGAQLVHDSEFGNEVCQFVRQLVGFDCGACTALAVVERCVRIVYSVCVA